MTCCVRALLCALKRGAVMPKATFYYVDLLISESHPTQTYVGFTEDLRQRLQDHNDGNSAHTKKFTPRRLETYLAFDDRNRAIQFEHYPK